MLVVRDAIQSAHVETLQGIVSFDRYGDINDRTISVFQGREDSKYPLGCRAPPIQIFGRRPPIRLARGRLPAISVPAMAPVAAWLLEAAASVHHVGGDSGSELREPSQMPWTADDAERHTHRATTWELKELWAKVANECLERTGNEGQAIREANAVVRRQAEASF
jgi:hypothetical protein